MAHKYPSSWKNCSTCAFWVGTRTTDYFANWVEVDSSTATGKCLCRTSGWFQMNKQACASCTKYETWAPLRK